MVIIYAGRVQGVGFRYRTCVLAQGYEITGAVRNLRDGRVELIAEGSQDELDAFRRAIQDSELGSLVRGEELRWEQATGTLRGFEIVG